MACTCQYNTAKKFITFLTHNKNCDEYKKNIIKKNMFQVPSTIKKIATMADRGLRLTVDTNEVDPKEQGELFSLKDKFGWFVFSEQDVKESDVLDLPEIKPEFSNDKTPSQRLRSVLYRVWESQGSQKTFEEFYRIKMEEICNWLKEKYLE